MIFGLTYRQDIYLVIVTHNLFSGGGLRKGGVGSILIFMLADLHILSFAHTHP